MKSRHRSGTASATVLITALAAALLLTPAAGAAPAAGGATHTLEDQPKPPDGTVEPILETACAIDAEAVETHQGCPGVSFCDTTAVLCQLPGGLDHVAAGTGLRNTGWGTIQLRGAPPGAVPVAAWLYWAMIPANPGSPGAGDVSFNGVILDGELVGTAPGPCWSQAGLLMAYRAPVLELLNDDLVGDYPVRVRLSSVADGRDPWGTAPVRPPFAEGASLVVVYAHDSVPRGSRFYLHHGAHRLLDQLTFHHPLDPPLPAAAELRHTRIGADGQRRAGDDPAAPFVTEIAFDPGGWLGIRGPGSPIDPGSDWLGVDGGPINQLWDTQITPFPATALPSSTVAGVTDYQLRYRALPPAEGRFSYDCVGVVAHALTVVP